MAPAVAVEVVGLPAAPLGQGAQVVGDRPLGEVPPGADQEIAEGSVQSGVGVSQGVVPPRVVAVRRTTVRLHRQLVTLRSLIQRFEHEIEESENQALNLRTKKLIQRLDWLDTEIVELRDRSRLLQEEIMLKGSEQTNRSLHVLAIVTTVFLPATLVTGVFGMNVAGLPLTGDNAGFLWAIALTAGASALVYWLLRRLGTTRR